MFTGIVRGLFPVASIIQAKGMMKIGVSCSADFLKNLELGASIAIDGVCLTAVEVKGDVVYFDVIQETLHRTTLKNVKIGDFVNVERSAKFGDEIGGHLLSGHVYDTAGIKQIEIKDHNTIITFKGNPAWMIYLFSKGYIAIDGVSLTLVDVDSAGSFSVHLIPETLQKTTLGRKKVGDLVNIEIDSQTQAIVATIERLVAGIR
jgi:riboflavin synthase